MTLEDEIQAAAIRAWYRNRAAARRTGIQGALWNIVAAIAILGAAGAILWLFLLS